MLFGVLATSLFGQVETKGLGYDYVYDFTTNFPRGNQFALVEKGGKFGLINAQAKEVIPPIYNELGGRVVHGLLIAVIETDFSRKFGIIDTTGKVVIPFDFDCLCPDVVDYGYQTGSCNILHHIHGSVHCLTGDHGQLIVRQEKHYGLWHQEGRMITPCIYEYMNTLSGGIYLVKKEGKYGILAPDGKEIVACIYDDESGYFDDQGYMRYNLAQNSHKIETRHKIIGEYNRFGYALAEQNGLYGLVNRKEELIYPCESVNFIEFDDEGMAKIASVLESINMRYGIIDSTCKVIFPTAYDAITPFYRGYAFALNEHRLYRIDHKGGIKPMKFAYVTEIKPIDNIKGFYKVKFRSDLEGVLNFEGETIINPTYDEIQYLDKEKVFLARSKKEHYCDVFNIEGDRIQKLEYDAVFIRKGEPGFFSMRISDWEGRMKFIDGRFKEVVPCIYQGQGNLLFKDGRALAYKNHLVGVIDTNGRILLEVKYRSVRYFDEIQSVLLQDGHQQFYCYNFSRGQLFSLRGLTANYRYFAGAFICKNDSLWGMIDMAGNQIIPFQYDSLSFLSYKPTTNINALVAFKKNNLWGLIDRNGKIIYEAVFQEIELFSNRLIKVKKDSLYGLIDLEGNVMLPTRYQSLDRDEFREAGGRYKNFIIFSADHKYGLIDSLGKFILPLEYDLISIFFKERNDRYLLHEKPESVYFECRKARKVGLADKNGKMILPIVYELIESANDPNLFLVQLKGRWFYVDKNNVCQKGCD